MSAAPRAIRLGWVFSVNYLGRLIGRWPGRTQEQAPKRNLFITPWAGRRGIVLQAMVLALPLAVRGGQPFPQRDASLFSTFTVILVTRLVQGLSLPWLVRRLGVQDSPAQLAAEEQALRLTLPNGSLAYLEKRIAADLASPDPCLLTLREAMRRQARRLHGTFAANEATDEQPPSEAETQAATSFEGLLRCRLGVTEHQRTRLVALHRADTFSKEAIRQVELEVDQFEVALDTQLATVQQPS